MSNEDKLRAMGNSVREARDELHRAITKLREQRINVGQIELELAQKALYAAEQQGRTDR